MKNVSPINESGDAVTRAYVDAATGGTGTKWQDFTNFSGTIADGDTLLILDVSDTTEDAAGTLKEISASTLKTSLRRWGMPVGAVGTSQHTNNSSSTWVDIAGVSFAVESGRTYQFDVRGVWQSAATTTGLNLQWSGPGITRAAMRNSIGGHGASGPDSWFDAAVTGAVTTPGPSAQVVAATTNYMFMIWGFVTPSADGTLQLQFRSEVNASQVTVQQGTSAVLIDCSG